MAVELRSTLAKKILAQLKHPDDIKGHDSSVRLVSIALVPRSVDVFGVR
jgi:hypothetical protein